MQLYARAPARRHSLELRRPQRPGRVTLHKSEDAPQRADDEERDYKKVQGVSSVKGIASNDAQREKGDRGLSRGEEEDGPRLGEEGEFDGAEGFVRGEVEGVAGAAYG